MTKDKQLYQQVLFLWYIVILVKQHLLLMINQWYHYPLHLHKHHLSHLSLIVILVNLEMRLGDEVTVLITNLQIIQWDIFWLYQSMVKGKMVLFLMPTGPDSLEVYVSYGALFIPWMTGYLHNYIGCFPCQHGYIVLE